MQKQRKRKRPKDAQGIHKLAVFFIDHRHPRGKAHYFYSTIRQDQNNSAQRRLKYLVNVKWAGKVNWAGLYVSNQLQEEFKIATNEWQSSLKAAK